MSDPRNPKAGLNALLTPDRKRDMKPYFRKRLAAIPDEQQGQTYKATLP